MAVLIAVFTTRALRAFEFNRQQELDAARKLVAEESDRRDALRQEFLHRIVETQEEERTRIARELHDELGQALTGLAIGLRGAQTSLDKSDLLQVQLGQLEAMAVRAIGNMRHLINELRPAVLDDVGLPATLRQHVQSFIELTAIETTLTICQEHTRLPRDFETILFRVSQEGLTNVARHSQATHAWVGLMRDDSCVILQIQDDGLGFEPASVLEVGDGRLAGWGLMGIRNG